MHWGAKGGDAGPVDRCLCMRRYWTIMKEGQMAKKFHFFESLVRDFAFCFVLSNSHCFKLALYHLTLELLQRLPNFASSLPVFSNTNPFSTLKPKLIFKNTNLIFSLSCWTPSHQHSCAMSWQVSYPEPWPLPPTAASLPPLFRSQLAVSYHWAALDLLSLLMVLPLLEILSFILLYSSQTASPPESSSLCLHSAIYSSSFCLWHPSLNSLLNVNVNNSWQDIQLRRKIQSESLSHSLWVLSKQNQKQKKNKNLGNEDEDWTYFWTLTFILGGTG